jgi:hypothetical protein
VRERATIDKSNVGQYFLVRLFRNDHQKVAGQAHNIEHYCRVLDDGAILYQFFETCSKRYVRDEDWPFHAGRRHPNLYYDPCKQRSMGRTIMEDEIVTEIFTVDETEIPAQIIAQFVAIEH